MAGIREQDKFELWTEQLISLRKFVPRLFRVRNMFFLGVGGTGLFPASVA